MQFRIVVIGVSGSGKTSMAKAIAHAFAVPHVELDALNWDSGWHAVSNQDPAEFRRRVASAVTGDSWVVDGNYSVARDLVWPRATHLVWLDYQRAVIMRRVIWRTLLRIVQRTELWSGNQEIWYRILRPSHPIRWAWSTWRSRRIELVGQLACPDYAHLTVLRLRRPCEAAQVIARLRS